jgi:hypothetical protein
MTPSSKSFKDGEKFFIMSVVVQLWRIQGSGMESDGVYLFIFGDDIENCCDSIIGSISFQDHVSVRVPMGKYRSSDKHLFEIFECSETFVIEVPRDSFASEVS